VIASSASASPARRALLACALAGLCWAPARPAENLAQWAHSADLYFDTSPTGANVANPVRDFPVLVRLRASNFSFPQAMRKGQDLRFAKPDGKQMAYEIERWDSAGKAAEIWVRVDTVPGDYQGVFAHMYWGKPGSADHSDGNAVFNPAIGFESVWHMGGAGASPRLNSVGGMSAASPVNFDSDESREGAIGLCDSLDGNPSGDHLTIGDGYTEFSNALTISVWAYPTRNSVWSRLVDLGNGAGLDNICFARRENSQDLVLSIWTAGRNQGELTASGALYLNQWGMFTVTVSGKAAKIYRNGALVAAGDLPNPISNLRRAYNYIGRSNWAGDEYFAGKIDEVNLSDFARNGDWIKLAYANQKTAQNLVSFTPPATFCAAQKFAVPSDTSMAEGSSVELVGTADCASSYQWTAMSGPAPRILDPEVKVLQVALPRISRDTTLVYRFTANYGTSAKTKDVLIQVKESIPDPVFTFLNVNWSGKDSLLLKPAITNLSAIKASREPDLFYAWTASGIPVDTAWRKDGLLLKPVAEDGIVEIGLCLHNNGTPVCRTATLTVNHSISLAHRPGAPAASAAKAAPKLDARGRLLRILRSLPGFPADPG
jgi:hypothetical protein